MNQIRKLKIIDTYVTIVDSLELNALMNEWLKNRIGRYVCMANVHMCMEALRNDSFKRLVNEADLVLPDGRPLYWLQRLSGYKNAKQIRGIDLTKIICGMAVEKKITIGLYGGATIAVLDSVIENLRVEFPNIIINYRYSPPFRELTKDEDAFVTSEIKMSDVDVLFVGLGCPKQELWMSDHKEDLDCLMVGVGAAFDFIAKNKKMAPRIMQVLGLEWVFRLLIEPKRLWRRYLILNPLFIYHVVIRAIKTRTS